MRIAILLLISALVYTCKRVPSPDGLLDEKKNDQEIVNIRIEKEKQINIVTGTIEKKKLSGYIIVNGFIESNPNNKATISARFPGFIKKVFVHPGEYVKKGQKLATLENSLYLEIQQNYLETKAEFEYVYEDYKRQGELTIENATSIKRWQQAKRDYEVQQAKLYALKEKVEMLGLDPASLKAENISSQIHLVSPIDGNVSRINASLGKFCGPDNEIFEIINNANNYAHLEIHEKDAHKIKTGQKVTIESSDQESVEGTIRSVTSSIDETSRTITAHVQLEKNKLMTGSYLSAKIHFEGDSAYILPETALVRSDNTAFIFLKLDTGKYIREKVILDIEKKGYWSISGPKYLFNKNNIVLEGAYYLNAEFDSEE